jgi:hypothetical protein
MSGANVDSFEALREFRAAVATFAGEARDALSTYDVELRRTLDWILEIQPEEWKLEIRRSEDAIQQAKIDLARCRIQKLPNGGEPSCMEEKKALQKAKYRLEHAENKLVATRKWGQTFNRESTQYTSHATQLGDLFDSEMPKAISMLDRLLVALEAYVGVQSGLSPSELSSFSRPGDPLPVGGEAAVASPDQPAAAPSDNVEPSTEPGVQS